MYVISVSVSYPNSERLGWTGDWSPGLALGLDGTGDRSPGPKARTGTGVRAVCQDWDGLVRSSALSVELPRRGAAAYGVAYSAPMTARSTLDSLEVKSAPYMSYMSWPVFKRALLS